MYTVSKFFRQRFAKGTEYFLTKDLKKSSFAIDF